MDRQPRLDITILLKNKHSFPTSITIDNPLDLIKLWFIAGDPVKDFESEHDADEMVLYGEKETINYKIKKHF